MGYKPVCLALVVALVGLGAVVYVIGCSSVGGGSAAIDGGAGSLGGAGGDFGATQGGVQDMGLARELVEAGRVPPPEAFVVEGMYSEHDLGLEGEACERTLCLRGAVGVAPTLAHEPAGWLEVGLSSNIDPDSFERDSVTLIATVDVSGSMGWRYGDEQSESDTPGEVSRDLLSAIAAELGADDQIAMVTYGSTIATPLGLTEGDDQDRIQAAIDALGEGGSTNMEGGMVRAFEIAREVVGQTANVRVMVFTDVQPNVGATSASEFERLADEGAADGIGLTVMAIGRGLGQEVLLGMSQIRGGNAFSLFDREDVDELMADSWPWMISPIAYDLSMEVTPVAGFAVADAFGFPSGTDDDVQDQSPGMEVSTIFLSRRQGALLIQVAPDEGDDLTGLSATGRLTYTTPDGEDVEETLLFDYQGEELDEQGRFFAQPSVGKTVALTLLVEAMHQAAEQYAEDAEAAIATLDRAIARFEADAEMLGDAVLDAELELARDLRQLMQDGAEQGDLYEYGY